MRFVRSRSFRKKKILNNKFTMLKRTCSTRVCRPYAIPPNTGRRAVGIILRRNQKRSAGRLRRRRAREAHDRSSAVMKIHSDGRWRWRRRTRGVVGRPQPAGRVRMRRGMHLSTRSWTRRRRRRRLRPAPLPSPLPYPGRLMHYCRLPVPPPSSVYKYFLFSF